jgi:hypothetical protein
MALPEPTDEAADTQELGTQSAGEPPMPVQARIELRDYDPIWPQLYDREAARIRSILGERVVRLKHTGSTSVPGLAAKPIIDIVLEVPDSADEAAYLPTMQATGYVLRIRGPKWFQDRLFKALTSTRTCTCSPRAALRPTGCSGFVTGFAATRTTGRCMSEPSGSWPGGIGPRCSSTLTPRPQ